MSCQSPIAVGSCRWRGPLRTLQHVVVGRCRYCCPLRTFDVFAAQDVAVRPRRHLPLLLATLEVLVRDRRQLPLLLPAQEVVLRPRSNLPLLLSAQEVVIGHHRQLPLLPRAQEVFGAPLCRFLNFLRRLDAVLANFRLFRPGLQKPDRHDLAM